MTEVIVWQGWIGGVAIGIFVIALYLVTGKLLGVSTAYGNMCAYFSKINFFAAGEYRSNWRMWFIIGIPVGGLLAALTSPGDVVFSLSTGAMYDAVLPESWWAKGLWLMTGGAMIGFGARAAGGCQSGHAITGVALLNWPSMVAGAGFFVGGVAVVQLLFL
ncbi:MAG: YeeE/YedE thiosulfate transporter family protein [Calditrichia bacterium]